MYKKALSVIVIVLLVISVMPVLSFAEDQEGSGSVNGKVTVQATQPQVQFTLYSDTGYTTSTTEITPQVPVYMKITVSAGNPLEEVTVTTKLFADNNNTQLGTPPSNTNPETYVTFTITYNGTNWVLTSDTGGSSTWNIALDPNQQQPDPSSNSGSFYVVITFGKTAREANNGAGSPYADWDIIVDASIGSETGEASSYGYRVYFYSELQPQAGTIDFGSLQPNSEGVIKYVDGNSGDSFNVVVVANGPYDLKATSTSTWDDGNGHTISLVAATPGQGEFSLKIDDEEDSNNPGTPLNGVYVTTSVADASPFVDDASPTTESGVTHTVYMLITLGDNIHTGTYQGVITIHAVKG
ncbi:MAG: hypothetical protein GSR83_04010 [Desulfurococcales archaeon]|nr:hypothetical protein [Desulfurococcales archaeon]